MKIRELRVVCWIGILSISAVAAAQPVIAEREGRAGVRPAPGRSMISVAEMRPFRFVGVTSERFHGDGTLAAMTAACSAQYPGARMAFSDEYALSVNPAPIQTTAWIIPRVSFGNFSPGTAPNWFDAAGNRVDPSYTCSSWTNSGDDHHLGTVLLPSGAVISYDFTERRNRCSEARPVACVARR